MPPAGKKEAAETEAKLAGTLVEDDEKAAQDIATHADRPSGVQVYRWIGNYAQEFVGPNDTTPYAAPGDYVEIDLAVSPLAGEFWDDGLLIEAPGQTPGPAEENVTEEATTDDAATEKGGK